MSRRLRPRGLPAPTITQTISVSPSVGNTGDALRIFCTRLRAGTTVTIGGSNAPVTGGVYGTEGAYVDVTAPAHAAGAADVVVTDYHGIASLVGGFTYGSSPASLSFDNEPAGYTLIQDFACDDFPVYPASYQGWTRDEVSLNLATITDAAALQPAGFSDNKYIRGKFATTLPAGSGPFSMVRNFGAGSRYRKFFLGFALRHEAGWDNNPGPGNNKSGVKLFWWTVDSIETQLYCGHDNAAAQTTMNFEVYQQGSVDRSLGRNVGSAGDNDVHARIGAWVKYEIVLIVNSVEGVADGELHVWIDGVKTHQFTNLNINGDAGRTINGIRWNPTFGGGGSSPEIDMFQNISHIRMSGSN